MAIRSKLSPSQLERATRIKGVSLEHGHVRVFHVERELEMVLQSWEWEASQLEGWPDDAVRFIQEHAESLGHGVHRYVLRVYCANDKPRGTSSWCRVQVAREKDEVVEPRDELDGSQAAWMQHIQRSFEDERRFRLEQAKASAEQQATLIRQTTELAASVVKLAQSMGERVTRAEDDARAQLERERAELEETRANFVKEALELEREGKKENDSMFSDMLKLVMDKVGDEVAKSLAPELAPMAAKMMGQMLGDGAGEVATAAVDTAAKAEVLS